MNIIFMLIWRYQIEMDSEESETPIEQESSRDCSFWSVDIPFSIDEIKGTGVEKKEEKKTRKKAEPREKFTTNHLVGENGIPELIRNGRKLRLKEQKSIVLIIMWGYRIVEKIGYVDDDVPNMGKEWLWIDSVWGFFDKSNIMAMNLS